MNNKLPFEEWDSLPIESYKIILSEIKERFNSQIAEIISVTDKTTNYTIGFLSFLFGTSAFIFTKYQLDTLTWILFVLSAINTLYGVSIVKGRKGFSAGLIADNILTNDFDDPEFDKERLAYFNILKSYQIKIDGIAEDNEHRAGKYNIFLTCTIMLILFIAANTLLTIYYCRTFV